MENGDMADYLLIHCNNITMFKEIITKSPISSFLFFSYPECYHDYTHHIN